MIANNKWVRYVELNPIINMAYMAGVIKNEELMVFNTCFPPSRLSINSWLLRDWNHTSFPSDIRDQEIEGGMFKQWADLSIIYSDRVGFMFMEWILEDYIEKNAEQIRQILVSNFLIMIDISIIDWIVSDAYLKDEESARAWLFTLLRKKYKRYCYKIEDVWTSNKPFDSIIDIWNNVKYFVEFKYDRHKKFDPDKIKRNNTKNN